ncbi:hypothetical protein CYMTET_50966 [Cymbomonas tetramitiformis]|uniref:Uncharacterized protein n=1 Tax=Cymbomonas tetramitiformis TaxID=36881 RepID=A0AAE0BP04_9CHLO|nr:hypothetical protein CYMTET_50966 [Cymbomonas tetramitiformis]
MTAPHDPGKPAPTKLIDAVIPYCTKDQVIFPLCLSSIKEFQVQIKRIFVVSAQKPELPDDDPTVYWIPEQLFSRLGTAVTSRLHQMGVSQTRTGWYFQQLIKLYATEGISDLSEPYVVIDSDVIFYRALPLVTTDGAAAFYTAGDNFHEPYFQHMRQLTGGLVDRYLPELSGMCHYMVFHQVVLRSLFELVERECGRPFVEAFMLCLNRSDIEMGASEYELYFNYAIRWHPERVLVRHIQWKNTACCMRDPAADIRDKYDFVAYHTQLSPQGVGQQRTDAVGTPDPVWNRQGISAEIARASGRRHQF